MVRRKSQRVALERAFRRVKATEPRTLVRYSDELKRKAVEAVQGGMSLVEVSQITGVSTQSLTAWLQQFKRPALKVRKKRPDFRRLKVVGAKGQCASIFVGQDIRLEIPADLLSAELIRRLAGSAS